MQQSADEKTAAAPDWRAVVTRRLSDRQLDPTLHLAVIEELAQHLEQRYRSLIARGSTDAEAERSVMGELDDDALERELQRVEGAWPLAPPVLGDNSRASGVDGFIQDLRYAVRTLRSRPGFLLVAALTLALGVGANTAIFSVVNAVMLRPLPYPGADRLVRIWESNLERGWPQFAASHPNFLDWRTRAQSWEALAAFTGATFSLSAADGAQFVRGASVTVDFIPALGIAPVLGRNFRPEEDRPGADTRVAILTDGFWRRVMGADPGVLGKTIALNATPYTVIGVMPAHFQWSAGLDLLVPLAPDPTRARDDHRLAVVGRLKPGVTFDQASQELVGIAGGLAKEYPASNEGWSVLSMTFYDWIIPAEIRDSLAVLFGAVGLVLLIACGNVANLLFARAAGRQKELAIRTALGASRPRIVRQLLLESLLLSLLASALAMAAAWGVVRLLAAYGPTTIPRLDEVSVDVRVFLFALGAAVFAAFAFGLAPALQAARVRPSDSLQDASRGSTGSAGRQRVRAALSIAEVALSVTLLIGAGLLLRSFVRVQQIDPGFDVDPVMTMRVSLPRTSFQTAEAMIAFYERLLGDVVALPGVTSAATSSGSPLTPGSTAGAVSVPGYQPNSGEPQSADWRIVSPGFFATMGIPLKSGRDFSASDRSGSAPVTVISESLARRYWPADNPVGKSIVLHSIDNTAHTVIGVVGDVRSYGLDQDVATTTYVSSLMYGGWNPMDVVWRSATTPSSHVPAIREIVRRIDPGVPLYDVNAVGDLLAQSFGPRRFNVYVLGVFAGVALALSAIGLFGVMAYLVAQRTREIGVRLALGAEPRAILRLVIGRGLMLAVAGALIGVGGALWLTRLMESLLFAISATDPVTFATVPIAMIVVALAACYVPARRAMRVDPVVALRAE